jgi:uncharacterized protein (DUF486 family)
MRALNPHFLLLRIEHSASQMLRRNIRRRFTYAENKAIGALSILTPAGILRHIMADYLKPILLLCASNIFMTFAWYGHLKFTNKPLILVIVVSWLIAFFEYCLAVPANRMGHGIYSAAELKTIQEVITLSVFAGFSVLYLGENITINHIIGFGFICLGAFFVFKGPF